MGKQAGHRRALRMAAALVALSSWQCDNNGGAPPTVNAQTGSIDVTWTINGMSAAFGCTPAGAALVRLRLAAAAMPESVQCMLGQRLYADLVPAAYTLSADLVDGQGAVLAALPDSHLSVTAGHTTPASLAFTVQPPGGDCMNRKKDGSETDEDCGGGTCPACADGKACAAASDCASGTCTGNVCASSMMCRADAMACTANAQCCSKACKPVANGRMCSGLLAGCTNGVKNVGEVDVDCGGDCAPCANGKACTKHEDCDSDVCRSADGVTSCTAPAATCSNNVQDAGESDVDCGGMLCPTCLSGKKCTKNSDCWGGCKNGACAPLG